MVLFHSSIKTPRLDYILDYLFKNRLSVDYAIISELPEIENKSQLLINYSDSVLPNAWNIIPSGLLNQDRIFPQNTNFLKYTDQEPDLNDQTFDVFSAMFFHLSRYEEYLENEKDEHGRFTWKSSCISKANLLEIPFIDQWVNKIAQFIQSRIQIEVSTHFKYEVQPTMDIDSVYAYSGRSVFRNIGAMAQNLLKFNFKEIQSRLSVILLGNPDPNDNFKLQEEILGNRKMRYFVQVSDYGPYDKNIDVKHPGFKAILKKLFNSSHTIGLHPGYKSFKSSSTVLLEKLRLENAIESKITSSRQHFLRFELPHSYRILIEHHFQEDHSMGYSEVPGFRAGTACPFFWFDLEKNCSTTLKIVPFCCMDVAFKQFLKLNPEQTVAHVIKIKEKLKTLDVPFVFVFHNESLSNHRGWENWQYVFRNWISE
ncbi:MAG TPA: polysaccharide deacetylase family protein [Bacteroidia bacterium]